MEFHIGQLRGSIDRHEQIQLPFLGAHFGNIDVDVANGVFLELLLRLVPLHRGKAGDAVCITSGP